MMNYPAFTDIALLMLYDAVRKAVEADTAAVEHGQTPPCQTSTTPDWRDHARGIEDELVRRDVAFIPVRFLD